MDANRASHVNSEPPVESGGGRHMHGEGEFKHLPSLPFTPAESRLAELYELSSERLLDPLRRRVGRWCMHRHVLTDFETSPELHRELVGSAELLPEGSDVASTPDEYASLLLSSDSRRSNSIENRIGAWLARRQFFVMPRYDPATFREIDDLEAKA